MATMMRITGLLMGLKYYLKRDSGSGWVQVGLVFFYYSRKDHSVTRSRFIFILYSTNAPYRLTTRGNDLRPLSNVRPRNGTTPSSSVGTHGSDLEHEKKIFVRVRDSPRSHVLLSWARGWWPHPCWSILTRSKVYSYIYDIF
jgi:hypothetical protein